MWFQAKPGCARSRRRALPIGGLDSAQVDSRPLLPNNSSMPAVIETEGLTKDYPVGFWLAKKRRAVDGLTLAVESGEIFGFLGPNGAGKTTTIKLLVGLTFPTAGTARILSRPVSDVRMHRDIGYLPEQPYFYDYLTAEELLDYFARFFDFTGADRRARITAVLKSVGLDTAHKIQLRKYSKGMLQRVGLAQAILHDPQVVILDEPMAGLDPLGRREVRDIILELRRRGRTVLFSTHILSDAETLCDRVGVIVGGKLRGIGSPGEIVSIKTQGVEIVFEMAGSTGTLPETLLASMTRTGSRCRIEVPEEELYAALDALRGVRARVLSVAQIKPSLEDFFLDLVAADRAQAAAVEVSGK